MRIWVSAVAAAMLAAGGAAHADVVDFDGAEIVVGAPEGYCPILEEHFSVLKSLLLSDDPGDVLTAFARCEEVDEVAAGAADTFRHYGLFVGVRDEAGDAVRPAQTLEEYLSGYEAAQFQALDAGPRMTTVGMNGDHVVKIEPVGLVSKTEEAHFAAMTIRPEDSSRPAVTTVIGRTLIQGVAVQLELYAPEEEAPIPELVFVGREAVAALWEANAAEGATASDGEGLEARREASEAPEGESETQEGVEEGSLPDEGVSEEEDLAAMLDALSGAGQTFQALYWIFVGYLCASIALGIGIFAFFKLRPKPA